MAESDAATMATQELGQKVEIPVPEGMIPVHDNKATPCWRPGRSGEVAQSMEPELMSTW